MQITPILWKGNRLKDGTYPIKVRVSHNTGNGTKVKYFPEGEGLAYIHPDDWDIKASRVKSRRVNSDVINLKISELKADIEKNYVSYGLISTGNKSDFYHWFDLWLKDLKSRIKPTGEGEGYYLGARAVRDSLKSMAPEIPTRGMNHELIKSYESYLIGKGRKKNTIAEHMNKIRTVVKMVVRAGVIPYQQNPFEHYTISGSDTFKERLNEPQIKKLEAYTGSKAKMRARSMYLLSYYTGGIRWGDLVRLKWEMIKYGRLSFVIHKTGEYIDIELNAKALAILDEQPKTDEYIFPLNVDWKRQDVSIAQKGSVMRTHLKQICEAIGLPYITIHSTRNSIADLADEKEVSTRQLKGVYGHKKESTTQRYQSKAVRKNTDEAMRKLFG